MVKNEYRISRGKYDSGNGIPKGNYDDGEDFLMRFYYSTRRLLKEEDAQCRAVEGLRKELVLNMGQEKRGPKGLEGDSSRCVLHEGVWSRSRPSGPRSTLVPAWE